MESLSEYLKHNKSQLSSIYLSAQIQKELEKLNPGKVKVIVRPKTVVFECQNASQIIGLKSQTQKIEGILTRLGVRRAIRFRVTRFIY